MLRLTLLLLFQLSYVLATTCPAGGIFESNFNRCYIYYSQPEIFLAAESTCRAIGGHLAEIRNGFENSFVAEVVGVLSNGTIPSVYWIGANLLMAPKWTWTTNNTALYTNWAADQPADPSSFDCATVKTDGTNLWKKELCYSAQPFVCTANPTDSPAPTPAPTSAPDNSPCDPGYIHYGNQCYKLFNNPTPAIRLNYFDSEIFCRVHENASLPVIQSQSVQDFIFSVISNEDKQIWLGLGCYGTCATCCWWVDGSVPSYFNYWPGHPLALDPLYMRIENGTWYSEVSFAPIWKTAVMCQKPARNVFLSL